MEAIILAGGFGTRLQSIITHLPKPMAPIHHRPFLSYLLDYIKLQGITRAVISVHHLRDSIQEYFGFSYHGIDLTYAIEEKPLGTGGAIIHALNFIHSAGPIFVINGDTFLKIDYRQMYTEHIKNNGQLSIALRKIDDCSRYGEVMVNKNKIIHFKERGSSHPGLISAGLYLLHRELFSQFSLQDIFSFEHDFLFLHAAQIMPYAWLADDYFIDIGIPEDYLRATRELPQIIGRGKLIAQSFDKEQK